MVEKRFILFLPALFLILTLSANFTNADSVVLEVGEKTGVELTQLQFLQTTPGVEISFSKADAEGDYYVFSPFNRGDFRVKLTYDNTKTTIFTASKLFIPNEFFAKNKAIFEYTTDKKIKTLKPNPSSQILRFKENLNAVSAKSRNIKFEVVLGEAKQADAKKIKLACDKIDKNSFVKALKFGSTKTEDSFVFENFLAPAEYETSKEKKTVLVNKITIKTPQSVVGLLKKPTSISADPASALETLCDGYEFEKPPAEQDAGIFLSTPTTKQIEITSVKIEKNKITTNYKKYPEAPAQIIPAAYLKAVEKNSLEQNVLLDSYDPTLIFKNDLGTASGVQSIKIEAQLDSAICSASGPQWLVVYLVRNERYDQIKVDLSGTACASSDFTQMIFTPGKTENKILEREFDGKIFEVDITADGKFNLKVAGSPVEAGAPLEFGTEYVAQDFRMVANKFSGVAPISIANAEMINCFEDKLECVVLTIAKKTAVTSAAAPNIKSCEITGEFYQGNPRRTWTWEYETPFEGTANLQFSLDGKTTAYTILDAPSSQKTHVGGSPKYKSSKYIVTEGGAYSLKSGTFDSESKFVKCSIKFKPDKAAYAASVENYLSKTPSDAQLEKEEAKRKGVYALKTLKPAYADGNFEFKTTAADSPKLVSLLLVTKRIELAITAADGTRLRRTVDQKDYSIDQTIEPNALVIKPNQKLNEEIKNFIRLRTTKPNGVQVFAGFFSNYLKLTYVQGNIDDSIVNKIWEEKSTLAPTDQAGLDLLNKVKSSIDSSTLSLYEPAVDENGKVKFYLEINYKDGAAWYYLNEPVTLYTSYTSSGHHFKPAIVTQGEGMMFLTLNERDSTLLMHQLKDEPSVWAVIGQKDGKQPDLAASNIITLTRTNFAESVYFTFDDSDRQAITGNAVCNLLLVTEPSATELNPSLKGKPVLRMSLDLSKVKEVTRKKLYPCRTGYMLEDMNSIWTPENLNPGWSQSLTWTIDQKNPQKWNGALIFFSAYDGRNWADFFKEPREVSVLFYPDVGCWNIYLNQNPLTTPIVLKCNGKVVYDDPAPYKLKVPPYRALPSE